MFASRIASRTAMVVHRQQKRGMIDWMVKWPDKVRRETERMWRRNDFINGCRWNMESCHFYVFVSFLIFLLSISDFLVAPFHLRYALPCIFKVMEYKKIQLKGGTLQGSANPTWYKQEGDTAVLAFGTALVGYGMFQFVRGFYRLATGTGRME